MIPMRTKEEPARQRRLTLGPTSPCQAFLSLSIVPLVYATAHPHRSLPLTTNGTLRESLRASPAFRSALAENEAVCWVTRCKNRRRRDTNGCKFTILDNRHSLGARVLAPRRAEVLHSL